MNKTLSLIAVAALAAVPGAVCAQTVADAVAHPRMAAAPSAGPVKKASVRMNADEGSLKADFTVKGAATSAPTWSEKFDAGKIPAGWSADPTRNVTWTVKEIAPAGQAKSFSAIDPDDKGSLFVEGPYQTYKRETSRMSSAPMSVGANATLKGYVGFSQNYDNVCRLSIEASADGFTADSTLLWSSADETGEKPWRWHELDIDMAAYAGKTVTLRFTYGPGSSDSFNTGGYLGDFAIDGLVLSAMASVDGVDAVTGQKIEFVDLSSPQGAAVARHWSFPGGVPSESSEAAPVVYYTADGDYDVSLTVTDAAGKRSDITRPVFVHVTGTAPVAHIGLPATFRLASTRLPLVAPLVPVTFSDASEGFPTEHHWTFSGVSATPYETVALDGPEQSVSFAYRHQQAATLDVANSHGSSSAAESFSVEYDGSVTNFLPGDAASVFDLDGYGEFPGTNKMKITAYAEKFSKPSRPVVVQGAHVFFTEAKAEEVVDQIANIGVHLYTSENGLPGKCLDSMWWSLYELDTPQNGSLVGTAFEFTKAPVVDDEFFIVVDGIPEKNETCTVSFAMAGFRDKGNSAYMLKDGKWVDVSTYFPAGKNHTSYMIQPYLVHSVISNLPQGADPTVKFDEAGGTADYELFSIMGYKTPVEADDSWVKVTSVPNGLTVDTLAISAEPLPAGIDERSTCLRVSDGASEFEIPVVQKRSQGVASVTTADIAIGYADGRITVSGATAGTPVAVYDAQGRLIATASSAADESASIDTAGWAPGIYIATAGPATRRIAIR